MSVAHFMLGGQIATSWDPGNKAADIALSGGNFLASRSVNTLGAYANVLSTSTRSTGKPYFEIARTGAGNLGSQVVGGICAPTMPLSGSFNAAGITPDSAGYSFTEPGLNIAGALVCAPAAILLDGAVGCFAIDFVSGNMWVRPVGGDWNGSALADPATNTGGFSFAAAIPGAAFIVLSLNATDATGGQINAAGPFSGAVPAGFTAWG